MENRNISGIALSVKTAKGSMILPGDSHYRQISRDILSNMNYNHIHNLVVPHNGGNAGTYFYNPPTRVTFNKAIISVGANIYNHPFDSNINALRSSGFTVKETNKVGSDISILL